MVHCDFGWSCPQCGSAIIEPVRGETEPASGAMEQPARAAASTQSG
jgi:hypothetical protein